MYSVCVCVCVCARVSVRVYVYVVAMHLITCAQYSMHICGHPQAADYNFVYILHFHKRKSYIVAESIASMCAVPCCISHHHAIIFSSKVHILYCTLIQCTSLSLSLLHTHTYTHTHTHTNTCRKLVSYHGEFHHTHEGCDSGNIPVFHQVQCSGYDYVNPRQEEIN